MNRFLVALLLLLSACPQVGAQGLQFFEGTWEQVLQESAKQGRPVFVDVYTAWCGPCKKMAKEIFTQAEAGAFYNARFINYKVDAEKGEGIEVARRFNVSAYPTCLFISPSGRLISHFLGAQSVEKLLQEGEKALKNFALLPEIEAMDAEYAQGRRDRSFLQAYCAKRSSFGEVGGRPVNDLLSLLPDEALSDQENREWVQSMTLMDDVLLERCILRLGAMDKTAKREMSAFNKAIMRSISTFINQAMEDGNRDQLDRALAQKARMSAIDKQNEANELMASMGGGIAYIAPEQIKLNFFAKHGYREEFAALFLDYLHKNMAQGNAEELLRKSDEDERSFRDFMQSDTIAAETKEEVQKGRGMMKLFSGIKSKILASSLYTAAEHYWELNAPQTEELRKNYVEWLCYIYALNREAAVAIPVAQKLKELGEPTQGIGLLENLRAFLRLTGDPEGEAAKVEAALDELR